MNRSNDPFRELAALQERVNRIFEETLGRSDNRGEEVRGTWAPPVDIFETGDLLVLRAELPGLSEDEVRVHVEGSLLTIAGERPAGGKADGETWHRVERNSGRFFRSFALPAGRFSADRASASFEDGVLTVSLPRLEESRARRIPISASAAAIDLKTKG